MLFICFLLFLLGGVCAIIAVIALVVALGASLVQAFATCAERSLEGFSHGHLIVALLYTALGGWFVFLIYDGLCLAYSFFTTVLR